MKKKTLAAAIRKANASDKERLAFDGCFLSPLQRKAKTFLWFADLISKPNGRKFGQEHGITSSAEQVCAEFLDVLEKRDAPALRSLAAFLESDFSFSATDNIRSTLLVLKGAIERGNFKRRTATELAAVVGYVGDLSRFRKLCKELGCPLAADKVGRPKTIRTNRRLLPASKS